MKRELNQETKKKILKMASTILYMHGNKVGDRICQDWSGSKEDSPQSLFTPEELDDLEFNYQQSNSNGKDYNPDYNGMNDEMVASFSIAQAIEDMIN